jgi:hypothetical protein
MNQIAHHHHTLDPAEGPDVDVELSESVDVPDEDDGPVAGSDAVASPDAEDPFD